MVARTGRLKRLATPDLEQIGACFAGAASITAIRPLGEGLVNDTYLVTTDQSDAPRFVLQRINREVFPEPSRIMENFSVLLDYAARRTRVQHNRRCEFSLPPLRLSADGATFAEDRQNGFWRAMGYVEDSMTLDGLQSERDAREVGFALGSFHQLLHGLDCTRLHDTLPGFHITPGYLDAYDRLRAAAGERLQSHEVSACVGYVERWRGLAGVLEQARSLGHIRVRAIHGDPKLNNILFDTGTREAVSLIDLDTVKPGLLHHDIADCLRSACNRAGEINESVCFEADICESILDAYLEQNGSALSAREHLYMYDAIRLLPYELGLRFFSDYLNGNGYFRVHYPEQNLQRAIGQFRLVESIERQEAGIRLLLDKFAAGNPGA